MAEEPQSPRGACHPTCCNLAEAELVSKEVFDDAVCYIANETQHSEQESWRISSSNIRLSDAFAAARQERHSM